MQRLVVFSLVLVILAGCGRSAGPERPTIIVTSAPTSTAAPTTAAIAASVAATLPTSPPVPNAALTQAPTRTPTPGVSPKATLAATRGKTAVATRPLTPVPPPPTPCPDSPAGSFLTILQSEPKLKAALGCTTSFHPRIKPAAWPVKTAYQPFEHGAMVWSDHLGWFVQPEIYALYADSSYERFDDNFDGGKDPIGGGAAPPPGLVEPLYGFGKLWRGQPGVRAALGWATLNELGGSGRFQLFTGGEMVWISQTGKTYVFVAGSGRGKVYVFDIPYSDE